MTNPLQGTLENLDGAWVLTLVRDFEHPPEKVWPWLTDPDRLRRWSPIVPDRPLDSVGPRLVREPRRRPGSGDVRVSIRRANRAPVGHRCRALAAVATESGCRLTLEQTMRDGTTPRERRGWHICLDVLDEYARGRRTARVVGEAASTTDGSRCATTTPSCSAASYCGGAPWKTASTLLPSGSRTKAP